jgi:hypothetical protein
LREGKSAKEIARLVIEAGGFRDLRKDQRQPGGVDVAFTARDREGALWLFDVPGSFTTHRAGLKRSDVVWKALGKAAVLREAGEAPLVLLTTGGPSLGGGAAEALKLVVGPNRPIRAVVDLLAPSAPEILAELHRERARR